MQRGEDENGNGNGGKIHGVTTGHWNSCNTKTGLQRNTEVDKDWGTLWLRRRIRAPDTPPLRAKPG
jgi:hypothetical protein